MVILLAMLEHKKDLDIIGGQATGDALQSPLKNMGVNFRARNSSSADTNKLYQLAGNTCFWEGEGILDRRQHQKPVQIRCYLHERPSGLI